MDSGMAGQKLGPKPFVFGVDLDGVVSDFVNDLRPIAAEWMGVPADSLTKDVDYNFTNWGLYNFPGGYPPLHKFAVVHRKLFANSRPVAGAIQALRNLSAQGVYIRFITSRICISNNHAEIVKQTVDWLDHHDIPYWEICFVKDKRTVEADLYIDDSPANITMLRSAGKNVIAFASSVNEGVESPRTSDWSLIQKIVLGVKAAHDNTGNECANPV